MPNILLIETATDICSVGLTIGESLSVLRESTKPNSHAALTTIYIEECLKEAELQTGDLDAVAVSLGPGSYTGLRIGLSTAKGLCYAQSIPLIGIPTLKSLAAGVLMNHPNLEPDTHIHAMIDARRMEVYTACYGTNLVEIHETQALIIDETALGAWRKEKNHTIFCGNGAFKVNAHENEGEFHTIDVTCSAANMAKIAIKSLKNNDLINLAYSVPFYYKSPNITTPKKRL